ncbi:MAG: hypothetical protein LBF72_04325 [Holosporales bacterium]|nr:hypothetical protein [Holosporales bacterium]
MLNDLFCNEKDIINACILGIYDCTRTIDLLQKFSEVVFLYVASGLECSRTFEYAARRGFCQKSSI